MWRYLFDSPIDKVVKDAKKDYIEIGWDQILKGRISFKLGKAQGMFYWNNPDTRKKKHLSTEVWVGEIIAGLLGFILGLWMDRCNSLHGIDDSEKKRNKS